MNGPMVPIIGARRREFGDKEVCHVLTAAGQCFGEPELIMSLMCRAMISLCKTFGIPKATLLKEVEAAWDSTTAVQPVQHRVQ